MATGWRSSVRQSSKRASNIPALAQQSLGATGIVNAGGALFRSPLWADTLKSLAGNIGG